MKRSLGELPSDVVIDGGVYSKITKLRYLTSVPKTGIRLSQTGVSF